MFATLGDVNQRGQRRKPDASQNQRPNSYVQAGANHRFTPLPTDQVKTFQAAKARNWQMFMTGNKGPESTRLYLVPKGHPTLRGVAYHQWRLQQAQPIEVPIAHGGEYEIVSGAALQQRRNVLASLDSAEQAYRQHRPDRQRFIQDQVQRQVEFVQQQAASKHACGYQKTHWGAGRFVKAAIRVALFVAAMSSPFAFLALPIGIILVVRGLVRHAQGFAELSEAKSLNNQAQDLSQNEVGRRMARNDAEHAAMQNHRARRAVNGLIGKGAAGQGSMVLPDGISPRSVIFAATRGIHEGRNSAYTANENWIEAAFAGATKNGAPLTLLDKVDIAEQLFLTGNPKKALENLAKTGIVRNLASSGATVELGQDGVGLQFVQDTLDHLSSSRANQRAHAASQSPNPPNSGPGFAGQPASIGAGAAPVAAQAPSLSGVGAGAGM